MIYASTFLLHSSTDKPLVEVVARELVRRGIITWLDKHELIAGASLGEAIKTAIQKQATVTVFLSPAALESPWVKEELTIALTVNDVSGNNERIIPIYLGDPVELVSSNQLLRNKWLHPDGDRVDRFGIVPQTEQDENILAKEIANEVARRIYNILKIEGQQEIVLYLDQRGEGLRRGEPKVIPDNIQALDIPGLIFRPNLDQRSQSETLYGEDWNDMRLSIEWALSESLGGVRWPHSKKIRILGGAQLGFPFVLGQHFNRNTSANLFCTNIDGSVFNNQGQLRHTPLEGGDSHCDTPHPDIQPIPQDAKLDKIALLLSTSYLVTPVCNYLAAHKDSPLLVWVKNDRFENNSQVMSYLSNVVALLMRLKREHKFHTVHLYCGLPFHVVPLLAANLLHVVENIIFMEFRRDLQGTGVSAGEMYVPLETKFGKVNPDHVSSLPINSIVNSTKTTILFLGANPSSTVRLRLGEEVKRIQTNLKLAKERDNLELKQEWAVTIDSLMQAILDESPNIVHFSGHAQQDGIILQNEIGEPKSITAEALASLFKLFKDTLQCVILNACYSQYQAETIKTYIPYVIGMKSGIPDKAAIAFSTGFYKAIGAGREIPFAFELGIAAIKLEGVSGDDIPILM